MAIEDAVVLARCVEQFSDSPDLALQRYEAARRDRTTGVVRRAGGMAATLHNDALADPITGAAHISANWSLKGTKSRFDDIYFYDAAKVPI